MFRTIHNRLYNRKTFLNCLFFLVATSLLDWGYEKRLGEKSPGLFVLHSFAGFLIFACCIYAVAQRSHRPHISKYPVSDEQIQNLITEADYQLYCDLQQYHPFVLPSYLDEKLKKVDEQFTGITNAQKLGLIHALYRFTYKQYQFFSERKPIRNHLVYDELNPLPIKTILDTYHPTIIVDYLTGLQEELEEELKAFIRGAATGVMMQMAINRNIILPIEIAKYIGSLVCHSFSLLEHYQNKDIWYTCQSALTYAKSELDAFHKKTV